MGYDNYDTAFSDWCEDNEEDHVKEYVTNYVDQAFFDWMEMQAEADLAGLKDSYDLYWRFLKSGHNMTLFNEWERDCWNSRRPEYEPE